jgi:hypothetical protein
MHTREGQQWEIMTMYTHVNFKTKKALKEAVLAFNEGRGKAVTYYQPNSDVTGFEAPKDGRWVVIVEGPHYPLPHKWYAACEAVDGKIVKVK